MNIIIPQVSLGVKRYQIITLQKILRPLLSLYLDDEQPLAELIHPTHTNY